MWHLRWHLADQNYFISMKKTSNQIRVLLNSKFLLLPADGALYVLHSESPNTCLVNEFPAGAVWPHCCTCYFCSQSLDVAHTISQLCTLVDFCEILNFGPKIRHTGCILKHLRWQLVIDAPIQVRSNAARSVGASFQRI